MSSPPERLKYLQNKRDSIRREDNELTLLIAIARKEILSEKSEVSHAGEVSRLRTRHKHDQHEINRLRIELADLLQEEGCPKEDYPFIVGVTYGRMWMIRKEHERHVRFTARRKELAQEVKVLGEHMSTELVEVGDTIKLDTGLTRHSYLITRVTKTLALSKREEDGYEHRFKRVVGTDMTYPYQQWNTSTYTVIRKKVEV